MTVPTSSTHFADLMLFRCSIWSSKSSIFFFFNDTAATEIYTLSLHDALPISGDRLGCRMLDLQARIHLHEIEVLGRATDRKSTRLNSSHSQISYAVFCLKKKNNLRLIFLRSAEHTPHLKSQSNLQFLVTLRLA